MITHIHHLNFLVNDLEQSIVKYKALLGCDSSAFVYDELESRNVKTARILLGQTWLILVQPVGDHGVPAAHLKKHGEGFFLLSLGCDDLDEEIQRITSNTEMRVATAVRRGLDNWHVRDLEPESFGNVQIQLTQEDVDNGEVSEE